MRPLRRFVRPSGRYLPKAGPVGPAQADYQTAETAVRSETVVGADDIAFGRCRTGSNGLLDERPIQSRGIHSGPVHGLMRSSHWRFIVGALRCVEPEVEWVVGIPCERTVAGIERDLQGSLARLLPDVTQDGEAFLVTVAEGQCLDAAIRPVKKRRRSVLITLPLPLFVESPVGVGRQSGKQVSQLD